MYNKNKRTINEVIEDFLGGQNGSTANGTLKSVGGKLYSYNLLIANTNPFIPINKGEIYDYSINTIEEITGYRSTTTRKHIGLIKNAIELQGWNNWETKEINKIDWEEISK
tara:strand:- start:3122 stop:3454 length:333 start_codon:yes stop_codon:yes gene_type:complete